MNKLLLASIACLAPACGSAVAADMPLKAPIIQAPPPAFSWTGCYLGGFAGLTADGGRSAASDSALTAPAGGSPAGTTSGLALNNFPLEYNANANGGGLLGCNYEFANGFVVGLEGEGGYLHNTVTQLQTSERFASIFGPINPDKIGENYFSRVGDWYALAAGRIGWANDRVLFYAKGGWAWTQVNSSISVPFAPPGTFNFAGISGSSNVNGFAVGGGMEWAFYGNWILRGEALYLGFQKSYTICGPVVTGGAPGNACAAESLGSLITAKVALEYKFDWAGAPVVAKY